VRPPEHVCLLLCVYVYVCVLLMMRIA